ncbi:MAG: hypothetical protein PUB32_08605 [Clostridiales bacterium]|nr:hypothetical protein [Clostridiales bacterium]
MRIEKVYTMQSGEQQEWVMSTGGYLYDFPPGRYRYIYSIEKDNLGKDCMYFVGESNITEKNAA